MQEDESGRTSARSPEEEALWAEYGSQREGGNAGIAARNRLIEFYLPLCRTIAATLYAKRGGLEVEFPDYMQFATLGLIEAVERFDPALGFVFATYATPRIRGSILNNLEPLSEQYSQIGLRKRIEAERLESLDTTEPAAGRRRRRDLLAELSELTIGLALTHLLDGSGMMQDDDGTQAYRQEFYDNAEQKQLQASLARLVRALPGQERQVIRFHYYHGLEFTEIARMMELSKGRISQIHRQAILLLRDAHGSVGRVDTKF
jgi:RNA polymerase sigma factor for flagellar operon FliA